MTGADGQQKNQPDPSGPVRPTWILILLMIALAIGIANVAVFVYSFTLPGAWHIRESVVIDAEPEAIFAVINEPRRWSEWSVWSNNEDPTLNLSYQGEASGTGASFEWLGEKLGSGKLVITDSEPNRSISYELELQGEPFSKDGQIILEPVPQGTRIIWSDGGELSGTLERLFRERLESAVSADVSKSLRKLKANIESQNAVTAE